MDRMNLNTCTVLMGPLASWARVRRTACTPMRRAWWRCAACSLDACHLVPEKFQFNLWTSTRRTDTPPAMGSASRRLNLGCGCPDFPPKTGLKWCPNEWGGRGFSWIEEIDRRLNKIISERPTINIHFQRVSRLFAFRWFFLGIAFRRFGISTS
jgi:hypothetical protein